MAFEEEMRFRELCLLDDRQSMLEPFSPDAAWMRTLCSPVALQYLVAPALSIPQTSTMSDFSGEMFSPLVNVPGGSSRASERTLYASDLIREDWVLS